jgi:hypothetical protein
MTKEEATIARLVRDLDLERNKRIQAERKAQALLGTGDDRKACDAATKGARAAARVLTGWTATAGR